MLFPRYLHTTALPIHRFLPFMMDVGSQALRKGIDTISYIIV